MSQFFASGGQTIEVSASASVLPNEYSRLISFRMDWLELCAVQGILKSLLQVPLNLIFLFLKIGLQFL